MVTGDMYTVGFIEFRLQCVGFGGLNSWKGVIQGII